jgi:hypothetical protein
MKEENEEQQLAALLRMAGPRPRVDAERTERVRAAVHEAWQRAASKRTRTRWFAGAAAAAMVLIVATVLLLPRAAQDGVVVAIPINVAEVQTVRGEVAPRLQPASKIARATWIETADSGTLSLNWNGAALRLANGTRLRLDSTRTATLERGAIYFDGWQSRVTIHTAFGDVRDIGTKFEVRVENDALRVRVREGRVDVQSGGEHAVADAATELVASAAGIKRNAIEISGDEWRWIEEAAPPVILEGRTLRDVVSHVAREKGLRVELQNTDGAVRLHGNAEFTPDEALEAAAAAASASYRIERGVLIVSGRR